MKSIATSWRTRAGLLAIVALIGMFAWLAWSGHLPIRREGLSPTDRTRDFYEFYCGSRAISEGRSPYDMDVGTHGYIYPPFLAWAIQPLALMDLYPAAYVWCLTSLVLLAATLFIAARFLARACGLPPDWSSAACIAAIGLGINIGPTRADVYMGQCQQWMNLAWAAGLVWALRRPWVAGFALGAAANIKYLTLAALAMLPLRGRSRTAAWFALFIAVIALLPALQLGWNRNLDLLSTAVGGVHRMVLDQPAEAGEPRINTLASGPSTSLSSAAARIAGHRGQAPAWAVAYLLLFSGFIGAVCWRLYHQRGRSPFRFDSARKDGPVFAAEWGLLIILALAFSPQTNSRHLAMLLLPALILVALWLASDRVARCWLAIAALVLLAGQNLPLRQLGLHEFSSVWGTFGGPSWCFIFAGVTGLWAALRLEPAVPRLPSAP